MSDENLRFTAQEYEVLLDWFMVSDPWPIEESAHRVMEKMLDEEAVERGYDDWVHAYHDFWGEQ